MNKWNRLGMAILIGVVVAIAMQVFDNWIWALALYVVLYAAFVLIMYTPDQKEVTK